MPLTISLTFPTGKYVAASWDDREQPEWPPHPARLCLGLVDALHRTGNPSDERVALQWLCAQGPPHIGLPSDSEISKETLNGFFVPQNASISKDTGINHPRKARSFTAVHLDPESPSLAFHWPDATPSADITLALSSLLKKLPRLGHSSSLCIATLDSPFDAFPQVLEPSSASGAAEFQIRVPYPELVQDAERAFDAQGRSTERDALISKARRSAKSGEMLRPVASPRARHDPPHRWHGYHRPALPQPASGPWDSRILVLKQTAGKRFDILSAWQITEILHKTLISRWNSHQSDFGPMPGWLSGHENPSNPETAPAPRRTGRHISVFPLPFVGSKYADGHLLGLGIAIPRPSDSGVDPTTHRRQWRQLQQSLFSTDNTVRLHALDGSWEMSLEPHTESPAARTSRSALQVSRWTKASTRWCSVTPVVLDRHPKVHFKKDPERWAASCCTIIAESCLRAGVPEPTRIIVSLASPLEGVPPSPAFVAPPVRPGRPLRFHVHATLEFAEPVSGPLLVGAGRFRGYGLFLPQPLLDPPTKEAATP
jgi:CRISPR-associated protein Csb2